MQIHRFKDTLVAVFMKHKQVEVALGVFQILVVNWVDNDKYARKFNGRCQLVGLTQAMALTTEHIFIR